MFDEIFQSLHESIKRRNTPDSYIPKEIESRDVIHRGYIKNSPFSLRYDFVPDNKNYSHSGKHIYSFADNGNNGIIEISHSYKPTNSGHETNSTVSFEELNGKSLEDIQIHRILIPALNHHLKSHGPDIVKFGDGIPYPEDLSRRLGSEFESFEKKTQNGSTFISKKKLDPKISRVISHIRNKINKKKEN